MNNLNEDIKRMEYLLKSTFADMSDFSVETYDEKISALQNKMNLILNHRQEMIKKYNRKNLLKYESNLSALTKLLQKKFDNVINEYNSVLLEIAQKLVQIGNRKKLANYLR